MGKISVVNRWMADVVNTSFKQNSIPLRISPHEEGETRTMWKIDYTESAATIDSVMSRVYEIQDRIAEKVSAGGNPMMSCTKEQALFMFASQHLIWMVEMDGRADHPSFPTVQMIMMSWMAIYKAKGGDMKQFGDKQA